MLIYIFKSATCMAIFFVFYKFLLERENMHVFKRFYLLLTLGASLVIPALVFTEYVVVEPVEYAEVQHPRATDYDYIGVPAALENDVLDIEPILWTVYFLGFTFFGLRFMKNLFQIVRRVRKNPKQKSTSFIQVLLKENFPPHTFFKYIFLNKKKLEANEIPKEVLLHEQTHAIQKHSCDVIFIELLQVIFWFNPLIFLFKRAIKLNHEFLADRAVLDKAIDKTTYQNTLLSYLSPDSQNKYQSNMANAINYSSTRLTVFGKTFTFGSAVGQVKKRFTVMKTHTSKKAMLFRSLLLLPLLAILLYGFSQKNTNYITADDPKDIVVKDFIININEEGTLFYEDNPITLSDISHVIKQAYTGMTTGEKNTFVTAYIFYDENQVEHISEVENEIYQAGLRNIEHVSQQTAEAVNEGKIEPSKFNGKTIAEARAIKKEGFSSQESIWFDIRNENEIWFDKKKIELQDLAEVISKNFDSKNRTVELQVHFYSAGIISSEFVDMLNIEARKTRAKKVEVITEEYIMPKDEFVEEGVEITPNTVIVKTNKISLVTSNFQDKASKKELDDYNRLAKKYNTMLSKSKSLQIKLKDVQRLEYIYGLMSDKQKADAEPFPDFPEPPPPPKAPRVIKEVASNIPPPPSPKKIKMEVDVKALQNEIENKDIIVEENVNVYIHNSGSFKTRTSPPPDLMKNLRSLAKRDALFYFNGEKVTAQKGLQIVKNNKGLAVETYPYTKQKSEVRIYSDKRDVSIPPPPAIPTPTSPLDHVIEMAKKGADFYFEGKEISSDKAIDLMKKNKSINIDSRSSNGKKPMVRMSRQPISIDN